MQQALLVESKINWNYSFLLHSNVQSWHIDYNGRIYTISAKHLILSSKASKLRPFPAFLDKIDSDIKFYVQFWAGNDLRSLFCCEVRVSFFLWKWMPMWEDILSKVVNEISHRVFDILEFSSSLSPWLPSPSSPQISHISRPFQCRGWIYVAILFSWIGKWIAWFMFLDACGVSNPFLPFLPIFSTLHHQSFFINLSLWFSFDILLSNRLIRICWNLICWAAVCSSCSKEVKRLYQTYVSYKN